MCLCVSGQLRECCLSVFKQPICSHFNHKSNNSDFLSSRRPLIWCFYIFSLNFTDSSSHPMLYSYVSSGINQACSCVAWLHYIVMKFTLRCRQENGLAWKKLFFSPLYTIIWNWFNTKSCRKDYSRFKKKNNFNLPRLSYQSHSVKM